MMQLFILPLRIMFLEGIIISNKVIREIGSWISSIGIAVILVLFTGIFVFLPFRVEGYSMEPTLHNGERIYVSKLSSTFSYLPDYGDIVVIDSRVDRTRTFKDAVMEHPLIQLLMRNEEKPIYYVKRVIGKPGDILVFKDHKVFRNGEELSEPYIKEVMNFGSEKKWVVPDNHIFVLGDNRNHSSDSRDIGPIPLDHVIGICEFP